MTCNCPAYLADLKRWRSLIGLCMALVLLPGVACTQSHTATLRVFFASGQATLNAASTGRLDSLAAALAGHATYEVRLRAHADSNGDSLRNLQLSQRRAEAVEQYLQMKGVVPKVVAAAGDREPVRQGRSEVAWASNRRVDIWVRYQMMPTPPVAVPEVPKPAPAPTSMDDLYALLNPAPQEFCIQPNRDTILRCKQGTLIEIKANSFSPGVNCLRKCVRFQVKEVYDKSDMVLNNLSTTSNGRILISQGMTHTQALDCEGKPVALRTPVVMVQPSDSLYAASKTFGGQRVGSDSSMNWIAEGNAVGSIRLLDLLDCYAGRGLGRTGDNCGLLCKIGRFIKKVVGGGKGKKAKDKKKGQRLVRRKQTSQCMEDLESLMKAFGVKNTSQLAQMLTQKLLDELGFKTMEELMAWARQTNRAERDRRIRESGITDADMNYYIFQNPRLGWKNVDVFANFTGSQMVDMKVDILAEPSIGAKLVFKDLKVVLDADVGTNGKLYFKNVPVGQRANLVVIRYREGVPSLCIKPVTIGTGPFTVEFKEYGLEEFKRQMEVLDQ